MCCINGSFTQDICHTYIDYFKNKARAFSGFCRSKIEKINAIGTRSLDGNRRHEITLDEYEKICAKRYEEVFIAYQGYEENWMDEHLRRL